MNLKNILIFGDSYSTFEGYIPDGFAVYYSKTEGGETDVRAVEDTWWYQLLKETELKSEIMEGFKAARAHYGIKPVALHNIDKRGGHPTIKGMEEIKNQIIDSLG